MSICVLGWVFLLQILEIHFEYSLYACGCKYWQNIFFLLINNLSKYMFYAWVYPLVWCIVCILRIKTLDGFFWNNEYNWGLLFFGILVTCVKKKYIFVQIKWPVAAWLLWQLIFSKFIRKICFICRRFLSYF